MKNGVENERSSLDKTNIIVEVKFKEGDEVYERIRPGQKLIVSHYFKGVYYCKVAENPNRKKLIYLENELMTVESNRGSA